MKGKLMKFDSYIRHKMVGKNEGQTFGLRNLLVPIILKALFCPPFLKWWVKMVGKPNAGCFFWWLSPNLSLRINVT